MVSNNLVMVKQAGTRINLISSSHATQNMLSREKNTSFDWKVSSNSDDSSIGSVLHEILLNRQSYLLYLCI